MTTVGGDRIVCVGGSLHGRVIERPAASNIVYVDHGMTMEVVRPAGFAEQDNVTVKATQRFELYQPRRVHGLLVMLHTGLKPDEQEEQTVDALAIAASLTEGGTP